MGRLITATVGHTRAVCVMPTALGWNVTPAKAKILLDTNKRNIWQLVLAVFSIHPQISLNIETIGDIDKAIADFLLKDKTYMGYTIGIGNKFEVDDVPCLLVDNPNIGYKEDILPAYAYFIAEDKSVRIANPCSKTLMRTIYRNSTI